MTHRNPHPPTIGVVVLTMGNRPPELNRALQSLLNQQEVELDVVVVGNGWDPVGLPAGVRGHFLEDNLGIPAGRNAGVPLVTGEYLCFLDDDSWFLDNDFLEEAISRFESHPKMGLLQPRITDPARDDDPTRWIPRLNKRTAGESSRVFHVGETCLLMPRKIFDATGGWAGGFWYAHEGIELAWRVWDTGHHVWYAGDLRIGHPVVDQRRHEEFYRLNARNRVWLAKRNLRWPFSWIYVCSWALLESARLRKERGAVRQYFGGWLAGWRESPWYSTPRPKLKWSTHLRMMLAGRPPVI
ncbi:glycosyltransferase family 2 protein [Paeniglutamicibacter gangotriensis]|uniref:Glycosyltransferase family 2 protein n=1 Tax=Paeniglutamicibacter gangotriensis TaxID=254787 RepID=A0A5B0E8V5_9MICC|nr:glycosyltransferase [Paeniglutamicibacter gangotriensis]KAA0975293.1 glycosyltransferase family 2 protein [Paeniglutamicibacter gangotriensis]